MAPNSWPSQLQYRPFCSRSHLWCFQYTEYKRGNKVVVSVHQGFSAVGYYFFGQFYPMPLVGQRLEEAKNREAVKDALKLPIAVCTRQTPLDFCQVQSRQSGVLGPSCTMQACGALRPEAHEYCEVQRVAGRKKHTEHKTVSFL